ncbi:hypothetical protein CLV58_12541 [Spirosoma oryzae]|uniref:Uncharacterized protein n=1 Tax=Spirosoma oryzae TaxID=1469603 RepID=A0A2T0S8M7_9BACT|nr:hypothetical protein [Spirosoma oryzae]PRY29779.1 hypothetical protein CLV58_12541 [Spirosoma oryzae]
MSKPKRLQDFEATDENPFPPEGVEHRTSYKKGTTREVIDGVGEVMQLTGLAQTVSYRVDTLPFVKVYMGSLRQTSELSVPATNLYWYVLGMLQPGRDRVTLDIGEFLDFARYTPPVATDDGPGRRSTVHYYRAIAELLDRQYLARCLGAEHTFFINTNRFFNGDRTKL